MSIKRTSFLISMVAILLALLAWIVPTSETARAATAIDPQPRSIEVNGLGLMMRSSKIQTVIRFHQTIRITTGAITMQHTTGPFLMVFLFKPVTRLNSNSPAM